MPDSPDFLAQSTCTHTNQGRVPHLDIVLNDGTKLRAPVLLVTRPGARGNLLVTDSLSRPTPARARDGRFMYALPGGRITL